jgi:hypothetical protein
LPPRVIVGAPRAGLGCRSLAHTYGLCGHLSHPPLAVCSAFPLVATVACDGKLMPLHGHVILIVEPDISFASELQNLIDADRGESIVARDPPTALQRYATFHFTAALVNTRHRDMVGTLMMPVVLYQTQEGERPVLVRLKMLLSAGRP